MKKYIGKFYEMRNIDGSLIVKIKVNYAETVKEPAFYSNGLLIPEKHYICVSENGAGWYIVNLGNYEKIVNK